MLDFLSNVYDDTFYRAGEIKFNKANLQHKTVISMYASIIEQTRSLIILLRENQATGVSVVMRSALEGWVDLINLTKDAKYIEHMMASYHSEWIRMLKASETGNNRFLALLDQRQKESFGLTFHKQCLATLSKKGIEPLGVGNRFKKAELKDMYESIYNHLCAQSHNNIRALNQRHIKDNDGEMEVVMFKPTDLTSDIITITGIYIEAGLLTHQYFGSNGAEVMTYYRSELAKKLDAMDAA